MQLRPYQLDAVRGIYQWFDDGNQLPLVVLPTGTGKSLVQAAFIKSVIEEAPYVRILCVTHSKELVKQNHDETIKIYPDCNAGIFSSGIGRWDSSAQVLFAGIQTAWRHTRSLGHFDLIIVDECHAISGKNKTATYHRFFRDMAIINPKVQIIGMTATPYRLDSGNLIPSVFDGIAYEYNVIDAINEGYLCEVVSAPVKTHLKTEGVRKRGGEFIPGELERAVDIPEKTKAAVQEMITLGEGRRCWLVFAAGNTHAKHITEELIANGVDAECLTQETSKGDRDGMISRHKSGELKCIVNNMILTTGFNNPRIDLLACLRPTQSMGLWVQMVGRSMRLFPNKPNALLLDFGRNLDRHGPIDRIRGRDKKPDGSPGQAPMKICPMCKEIVHAAVMECPACGHIFERDEEPDIQKKASQAIVFSNQKPVDIELDVYAMNVKRYVKDPTKPATMMVNYTTLEGPVREFICFDHPEGSRPFREAMKWAKETEGNNGFSIYGDETVNWAVGVKWRVPTSLIVQQDGKYYKIKERIFHKEPIDNQR